MDERSGLAKGQIVPVGFPVLIMKAALSLSVGFLTSFLKSISKLQVYRFILAAVDAGVYSVCKLVVHTANFN